MSVFRVFFDMTIVVLALVLLSILYGILVNPPRGMSRTATARSEVSNIKSALEMYKIDNGEYPSSLQGLFALLEKPAGEPSANNWPEGGYLDRLPKDPWGGDYLYLNPEISDPVEVYTLGADGKPGGIGECADHYSSDYQETGNDNECERLWLHVKRYNTEFSFFVILLVAMLLYLCRELYQSVQGNLPRFCIQLFFWGSGFAIIVGLVTPRIY
jgi:general secretion pathway protein G